MTENAEVGEDDAATKRRAANRRALWIIGIVVVCLVGVGIFIHALVKSGITKGPDHLFGDQHLKTTVALLELHKLRYGKYPDKLADIKFRGQWDELHLNNVSYYLSENRESYFVEVRIGWIGKPTLEMPDEFWQGTGYDEGLKPKKE